jgi:hypothetical protein
MLSIAVSAMEDFPMWKPPAAEAKTVEVREYLRCRNGKWEVVTSHFRKPRRKKCDL